MSININIYYSGRCGAARSFAGEMMSSGIVAKIRTAEGNLRYEYYYPHDDAETVLLIDAWVNQDALDIHHKSPIMAKIIELREKYDLHMRVERFVSEEIPGEDEHFIRK